MRLIVSLTLLVIAAAAKAQPLSPDALLPPLLPWNGASEKLIADANDPWITPAEQTRLIATPTYDDTIAWLKRLVEATPHLRMESIGKSAQGRDIWLVIAGRDAGTTEDCCTGKPTALVHGAIHAGEVDGKDAGLMLLRDLTVGGKHEQLLDQINLLFIPILNVDGHERISRYNRINQRGPVQMGWRTNARNLNLNRDFAKLETEGVRALAKVVNQRQPDLYLDLHVTDGADYQYDITFGFNPVSASWSPASAAWLESVYRPAVSQGLTAMGHIPGPLVFAVNGRDMSQGNFGFVASPRYSNGWGDARHLPTVLLENHSLKPYRQRVLGTYVFVLESLKLLAKEGEALRAAVAADRQPKSEIVLAYGPDRQKAPTLVDFKGIESELVDSSVAGTQIVRWTGKPIDQRIPLVVGDKPLVTVRRPKQYFIPAEWTHIAARLARQGVAIVPVEQPQAVNVERYYLPEAVLDANASPFEGRARYRPGQPVVRRERLVLKTGDWVVETEQPLGTLTTLLLEPQSPDSFFQWGYFGEILQRTEYFEAYAAEPLGAAMLAADPLLRAEFERALAEDESLAGNPRARLMWFYERSPYSDEQHQRYPITRSVE